jgi:tripartite-type tricarboxylate transporter receptor subunit TctC
MVQTAKVDIGHVPYRGDAPALNDLLGGHVTMMWNSVGSVGPSVRGGTLKPLAVGSRDRSPAFPDVPTATEAGLPGFESVSWFAMAAPSATSPELLEEIAGAVHRAVTAPDIQAKLAEIGAKGVGGTPEELRKYIDSETTKWKLVIQNAGISPQ